jgi:hypothetical protein
VSAGFDVLRVGVAGAFTRVGLDEDFVTIANEHLDAYGEQANAVLI